MNSTAGPSSRPDSESEDYETDEDGYLPMESASQMPVIDSAIDSQGHWQAREILDEDDDNYKINWYGLDPETKHPWEPSWHPKADATKGLIEDWVRKKDAGFRPPGLERKKTQAKRKRMSKTGTVSPKRARRQTSATTESRAGSKTPSSRTLSTGRRPVSAKSTASSRRSKQYVESTEDEDDRMSVSPVKGRAARKSSSVASTRTPDVRLDKGKGRAIEMVESADESTGNISLVPDSQSQESAKKMPPPKRTTGPVPVVSPEVFRPLLARAADTTILPSSASLEHSQTQKPSQIESIQQFSPLSRQRAQDDGTDYGDDFDGNSSIRGRDVSSSPDLPMKQVTNEDGEVIWVPAESMPETQVPVAAPDFPNDVEERRTIEYVLDSLDREATAVRNGRAREDSAPVVDDSAAVARWQKQAMDAERQLMALSGVQAELDSYKQRFDDVDLPSLQQAQKDLAAKLDTVSQGLAALQEEHAGMKEEHTVLRAEHTSLKQDHASLQGGHATLEEEHERLKGQREAEQIEALTKERDDAQAPTVAPVHGAEKQALVEERDALLKERDALKEKLVTVEEDRDDQIRRKETFSNDEQYALSLYRDASTKAVEFANANRDLEAQVSKLQEQLRFGLKQRELFNAAASNRDRQELATLKAQVKILIKQSHLTDDGVRERARRCDEVERRNAQLQENLEHEQLRNETLNLRNTELARRVDFLLAEQTGAMDEDESDFESEAEASDEDEGRQPPPPQPVFASRPAETAPAITTTTVKDMHDAEIEAAVTHIQREAEANAGATDLPPSRDSEPEASSQQPSQPTFASAAVNEWWACKWRDGTSPCPVLSKSRHELEQHAREHCKGEVDGQGANMVALS